MFPNLNPWTTFSAAFVIALVVCNRMTPPVKRFAERIGAMDIPKDTRRMHQKPIPRFGGLAIYVGTMVPLLIFLLCGHHAGADMIQRPGGDAVGQQRFPVENGMEHGRA